MICPVNGFKVKCKKCNNKKCYNDMNRLEKELTACWNRLCIKIKYDLINQFEKDYNLKIKIYDDILTKIFWGRVNAFTILPTFLFINLKINKKIRIYISKQLFVKFPLDLFEFIILHEIGHHKSKIHNSEDCANSFVLNKLGSDEYIKRKTQIDTFIRYRTFDISQLKKLQNINVINFIKVRLHLISLEDIKKGFNQIITKILL